MPKVTPHVNNPLLTKKTFAKWYKKSYFVYKTTPLQLSIIIVNYNVKYFLEQCLTAVIKACENLAAEIFVVDNNSADGSKEFFAGRFSQVKFIWCKNNNGFGKANNMALELATGKYILFLNPDTIIPEDCLTKSLAFFELQQYAGALGIRMVDGSGKYLKESKRGVPSTLPSLYKLSGLTALFPKSKIFARYYLGHLDENENQEVDILAGAFMLIKRTVLDKTGGFDERFFMYGEDVDLSYRIKIAGFKNIYFAKSCIIHFKGESTQRANLSYLHIFYGAMALFVKKHYNGGVAFIYSLLIKMAIWTKAIFLALSYLAKKTGLGTYGTSSETGLIIATEKEYDFIYGLLKKNNLQHQFPGRVNIIHTAGESALVNSLALQQLIEKKQSKNIIFSINGLSVKEIIYLIQHLKAGVNYSFHFEGTLSIVGSRQKDSRGECIA